MLESKCPGLNFKKMDIKQFWKRFEAITKYSAYEAGGELELGSEELKSTKLGNRIKILEERGLWRQTEK
jgi:hypothetical protein